MFITEKNKKLRNNKAREAFAVQTLCNEKAEMEQEINNWENQIGIRKKEGKEIPEGQKNQCDKTNWLIK